MGLSARPTYFSSSSPISVIRYQFQSKERMESSQSTTSSISITASPKSKLLLFDRRYGWVIDEWKDPSEEALAGGRGMFCILPLAKAAIKMASQSINLAASSAVKALERPELLQASLNDQLHKIKSSLPKPEFNYLILKGKLLQATSSSSSCEQIESSNS